MVTRLYRVYFENGSMFNIICLNQSQVNRFRKKVNELEGVTKIQEICSGIHTITQFEYIFQ